jgi:7-cyano-7-deazaguanine synthase in queuosine biosynthesis
MIWHVVARDGSADGFTPHLSTDVPRLFVAFNRVDDPFRMRERILEMLQQEYGRLPSASVKDLLRLAMAIYAADLSIPRAMADDNWTRDIILHLPVAYPELWNDSNETLTRMVSFLTGDRWTFEFRQRVDDEEPEHSQLEAFNPTAVSLFSGGMDSLIGALDLIAQGQQIALVGHHGGGVTKRFQKNIADALLENHRERLNMHAFHVLPPLLPDETGETTMRSRSILFIALGLSVADVCGDGIPLFIPENGLISLNIPLTGSRDGSASTRTTHPHFISLFRQLLVSLGINHPLMLSYRFMTKGEMLRQVNDQRLLARTVPFSMSCAHPEAERWRGGSSDRHCGYCLPCIIRQAAVYNANLTDGPMAVDIINNPPDHDSRKGLDLRAVKIALSRLRNRPRHRIVLDLLDSGPIPQEDLSNYMDVYLRGMEEVRAFIERRAL